LVLVFSLGTTLNFKAGVKTKCITSVSRLRAAFTDGLKLTNTALQHMLILHYENQSVSSACGKNRSLFEGTQALYKQAACRKLTGMSMELFMLDVRLSYRSK
jgi:hypothetical protein